VHFGTASPFYQSAPFADVPNFGDLSLVSVTPTEPTLLICPATTITPDSFKSATCPSNVRGLPTWFASSFEDLGVGQ
jgi:hypothetical protein